MGRKNSVANADFDEVGSVGTPQFSDRGSNSDPARDFVTRKKNPQTGIICEAIDFYMNEDDDWTQKYPDHIEEPAENEETARYAVLKRNRKSNDDPRRKFALESIVVQSPLIKKVLGRVFENYPGITTTLERLTFESPYRPFVYRWERLRAERESEQDAETKKHLDLLWDILEAELRNTLETRDDYLAHGVITYDYLWTLFETGTLITHKPGIDEAVVQIDDWEYSIRPLAFILQNRFVEWTGTEFGMEAKSWTIDPFKGTRKITDLEAMPLSFHPDSIGLQQRCIARGRRWEAHCKYLFKFYKGIALDDEFASRRYNVQSRVILDTDAFNSFNPNRQVTVWAIKDNEDYVDPTSDSATNGEQSLTPWQHLLAAHTLRGYSLKDKKWLVFDIENLSEITFSDSAFSRLVLPNDTKDLVLAFANAQIKREQTFDDIIEGKGKGIIMLLSGPPGVGKTLTAEAVAETMHTPLYMMSAADLGDTPSEVEEALKKTLAMTTKWKAVLLLDEADVFLEARSKHDLERNKLVSIFLRNLEYFEGFLFLTSNRVEDIDAAFESRIHLSLIYSDLSTESRRHVWEAFLASVKGTHFTDEQLDTLSQIQLNGRQIKNILKTAQLLASSKDSALKYEHVEIITRLRAANACIPLRT
ncbi:ATPase [Phlyctema vagabunda]|uniref:ATPase n=1 Tax=Phlyctema vagabunda TaxID=108571 RepID=A0ABR4PK45_9HELO